MKKSTKKRAKTNRDDIVKTTAEGIVRCLDGGLASAPFKNRVAFVQVMLLVVAADAESRK